MPTKTNSNQQGETIFERLNPVPDDDLLMKVRIVI